MRNILYWVVLEPLGFRATLELVCFIGPVSRCVRAKIQLKPLFGGAQSYRKWAAVMCSPLSLRSSSITANNSPVSRCRAGRVSDHAVEMLPIISGRCGIQASWHSCSFEVSLIGCGESSVSRMQSSPRPLASRCYDLDLIFSFEIIWEYSFTHTNDAVHDIPPCLSPQSMLGKAPPLSPTWPWA